MQVTFMAGAKGGKMKFLALVLASMVWAGVSWAADEYAHSFWLAFMLGGLAALLVICAWGLVKSAALATEFERRELRRSARERDSQ